MNILPHKREITKDLLTSGAELTCIAQPMAAIGFSDEVNKHFPKPNSNRGYQPSVFVNAMMLMLNEGGRCLDRFTSYP